MNGPNTHGLLKHDDSSLQVHAKVHHLPVNTFLDILFLFNNEHVVVEELLELFIDKVDGDLLKSVVLKNFKTSNVKHSTKVGLLQRSIDKCVVSLLNEPLEHTIIDTPGNTSNSVGGLLASLTLGDPLRSDLDPGLAEGLDHVEGINTTESSSLAWIGVRSNMLTLSLVITTLGLELNTSKGHDTRCQHVTVPLLLFSKSKNIEGIFSVLKLLIVINGVNLSLTLGHIDVVIDVIREAALLLHALTNSITILLNELVKNMVGSLNLLLLSNTRLLKQIGDNVATGQLTRGSEMDTDEFTKTRRVVISGGLGITIGLKNGVGGHNLVLKGDLLLRLLAAGASGNHGKIGDDLLGVLSLTCTRLTSDQHGVVLLVGQHVPVGSLSNGPEMGWDLITSLAKINLADSVGVQRIPLVRVDNNNEETRVGVDHLGLVTSLQVPEDRSIIEEGQVDHVLALLKLGWIDLANLGGLVGELLVTNSHKTLGSRILQVTRLQQTFSVSSSLGTGNPDRLLRVIGLLLVNSLHVNGREQELGGIWVHRTLDKLDMARHFVLLPVLLR